jgi:putative ABC transport system ATP-binding protein
LPADRRDDAVVRLEGVVRTYPTPTGAVQALRDVSGVLPRGAVTAVVGPSGSGKSSLLRLIAGMDRPTAGVVAVEDLVVGSSSARARRRLRRDVVGYVYQRPAANFLTDLTVGEHLRMAAGTGPTGEELFAILERLGIEHRVDHRPAALSGGEQQRAAFAQALASGARIVVADEPTAELDRDSSELVIDRMRALAADGVTVVIATHDPAVIAVAEHRLELEHGRLRDSVRLSADPEAPAPGVALRWPGDDLPAWLAGAPRDGIVFAAENVVKTYGDAGEVVHALRGVSLTASEGTLVGLVGRSGSGKTTLLNIAAGWERADEGSVDVPEGAPTAWADVAYVPQRLGLMDELRIRENVAYPARLAGELELRSDLIEGLQRTLGLDGLAERYPRETSLGEQQRTAIARALVLGPALLIADEPTGHQDEAWARRIFAVLADAAATGSCCLIATHDGSLAPYLDRVVTMADGTVVETG